MDNYRDRRSKTLVRIRGNLLNIFKKKNELPLIYFRLFSPPVSVIIHQHNKDNHFPPHKQIYFFFIFLGIVIPFYYLCIVIWNMMKEGVRPLYESEVTCPLFFLSFFNHRLPIIQIYYLSPYYPNSTHIYLSTPLTPFNNTTHNLSIPFYPHLFFYPHLHCE